MKIIDPSIAPYEIHIDELNHSVVRTQLSRKGKSEGQQLIFAEAYCTSLEGAIKWIIKTKVGKADSTVTLAEFLVAYKEMTKQIHQALQV